MGDDTQADGAGLGLRRTVGAGEPGAVAAANRKKTLAAKIHRSRKKRAGAGGVRFRWQDMVMMLFMMELLFGVKRLRPPCPAEIGCVFHGRQNPSQ